MEVQHKELQSRWNDKGILMEKSPGRSNWNRVGNELRDSKENGYLFRQGHLNWQSKAINELYNIKN